MNSQQYFAELFNSAHGMIEDELWDEAIVILKQCIAIADLPMENRMMVHYNLGYALTKGATNADEARQLMTPQEINESATNYKVAANIYNSYLPSESKANFKEFRDSAKAAITFLIFQLGGEIRQSHNRWQVDFTQFNDYPAEYNC
jgi:hypothetical protein